MACHYLFEYTLCTPASGWEKGRVERKIQTTRESFFIPLIRAKSFADANNQLVNMVVEYAKNTTGTTNTWTPGEVFGRNYVYSSRGVAQNKADLSRGTLTGTYNYPGYIQYKDLNGDGYMLRLEEGVVNPDDTDGDEIPDFLDTDDDGDFFTTKSETSYVHPNDVLETVRYYPFNGVSVDDPLTPFVDETKGVPDCAGNFTNPTRLRKYRDAACH
jgi:hypothetical protein